jgi:hypothetical protein
MISFRLVEDVFSFLYSIKSNIFKCGYTIFIEELNELTSQVNCFPGLVNVKIRGIICRISREDATLL